MKRHIRARRAWRLGAAVGALSMLMALTLPASGLGGHDKGKGKSKEKGKVAAGFLTSVPSMLTPVAPKSSVKPLISVGDKLPGGYMFESIPDGVAITKLHKPHGKLVTAFVNHETSLVPFPVRTPPALTESDMKNSELSELVLNRRTGGVLAGRYAIPSSANYQRFCSNFLATKEHGFERPLLFTNEEATDFVNRTGTAWPAGPNAEQAGVVVAYDIRTGQYRTIYGMGRLNHENSMPLPGYKHPVVLTGDDTFSAPSSQLYLYRARSARAVWNDEGSLYAFRSDDPAVNDYGDLAGSKSVSGTFIPVPREIAVGDQTALENWSNANNVFQFIRIEDTAYDRKKGPKGHRIVYIADTGEPRALPNPATGRLMRGPSGTQGPYPNGRIFRMVVDRQNPLRVHSLSVLIDGDAKGAAGAGDISLIHNPDNLETTKKSLLIQEDPGSHNQYAASNAAGTTARIWRYDLKRKTLEVVAKVNQALDPAAAQGNWESSGIVDASKFFGPGAFLVTVQAHSLWIDQRREGFTVYKREGGQLLLFRLKAA